MTQPFNPEADAVYWRLPNDYGKRYVLATCGDGAVLLDLDSGAFYRLNAVATEICRGLVRGKSVADIARELATAFQVPLARAAQDIEALLTQMRQSPATTGANPIRFEADATGFVLLWQGHEVCHLDSRTGLMTRRTWAAELAEPALPLLWAAPHILTLGGQFVLHASAIQFPDGVVAFCGPSGVGKTTLARLFAERGLPLVAEDLVLVAFTGTAVEVALGGESAVRAWTRRHAEEFAAGGPVATDNLGSAAAGPRAPLRELWFLGRSETANPVIRTEPLAGSEALVLLLQNSFAELGQRNVWEELFRANRRLAEVVRVRRAWCPEGLDVLRQAVAAYT